MSTFEFLGVFISVFFGLAMTHLVSGIGSMIQGRDNQKTYWVHILFTFDTIILISSIWWGMFIWGGKSDWNFLYFVLIISYSIVLYLIADILYPKKIEGFTDYQKHFLKYSKYFFGLQLLAILFDIPETYLKEINGLRPIPNFYIPVILYWIAISLLGLFSQNNEKILKFLAILFPATRLTFIIVSLYMINTSMST